MPTNGHDHEEPVVLPPNALDMRTTGGNNNNNNNNNNNQRFDVRDLLFYPLFYMVTLKYARIIPKPLRRLIEFVLLLMAVISFFALVYVHMNFICIPANCLDHVKDVWPRDGILRVEIIRSFQRSHAEQTGTINELFTVEKSYEREYKLKHMDTSEENASLFRFFPKNNSPENKREVDIEPLTEELVENKFQETSFPKHNLFNNLSFIDFEDSLLQSTSTKLPLINDHEVIFYENYIVEYSLEYGILCLSPSARNRLGIPVLLVVLEPTQNKCFGNSVGQFFLEYFLGYNELLMSSVKSLDVNEQNKGFFRNVNTGKYYIFGSFSMNRMSYIQSFFRMVLFTVLISINLRYAIHQIITLVDFPGNLHFHVTIPLPEAPFVTFSLAMVGIFSIMVTFFNDVTTAFYIVMIVCAAYIYDMICCYHPITKRYWLKFFFLYHFSSYAYHRRFDGQNSNLALICSWLFIQHSMVYFFHHYELPDVLHQAQQHQHQEQHQLPAAN